MTRGSLLARHPSSKVISEIPCRVNSDPHEKRNDWATVSAGLSVKL